MPRYIDADLIDLTKYKIGRSLATDWIDIEDVKRAIALTPTTDVVPKSEYEQLKAMYEDNETQRAYTINMLGESLENAKSEIEMLQGALKAEEQHNELTMEMAQKALKNAKAEVARTFRKRMNEKMGKHTAYLGKEYVQRIMREIKKEMTEDKP